MTQSMQKLSATVEVLATLAPKLAEAVTAQAAKTEDAAALDAMTAKIYAANIVLNGALTTAENGGGTVVP